MLGARRACAGPGETRSRPTWTEGFTRAGAVPVECGSDAARYGCARAVRTRLMAAGERWRPARDPSPENDLKNTNGAALEAWVLAAPARRCPRELCRREPLSMCALRDGAIGPAVIASRARPRRCRRLGCPRLDASVARRTRGSAEQRALDIIGQPRLIWNGPKHPEDHRLPAGDCSVEAQVGSRHLGAALHDARVEKSIYLLILGEPPADLPRYAGVAALVDGSRSPRTHPPRAS